MVVHHSTEKYGSAASPAVTRESHLPHLGEPPRPPETDSPETDGFVRDVPTVLSYAALGCFTFWLYAFGPAVTLLRDELAFSYTLLGVYSVVWSVGAAVAGAGFGWVARRLPRSPLLWGSAGA